MGMTREEFVARMSADMAKKKLEREKEYNDYVRQRVESYYSSGSGRSKLLCDYRKKVYKDH